MALDDRDRGFEKALARHLRYFAPSGAETDRDSAVSMPCPDPEILAAYHDGTLTSEERILWKQHVLGCDLCQLVLEHLATPLEAALTLESEEASSAKILAAKESPVAARAAAALRPARSRVYLGWLIPAGAMAAAALVAWMGIRTEKPRSPQPAPVEVARNQEPPAPQTAQPTPSLSNATPAGPGSLSKAKEADALAADRLARSRAAENKDLREQARRDEAAQSSPNVTNGLQLAEQGKLQERGEPSASTSSHSAQAGGQLHQQVQVADAGKKQDALQQAASSPVPAGEAGYLTDNSVAPSAAAKVSRTPAPPPTAPSSGGAPAAAPSNALDANAPVATESFETSRQMKSVAGARAALLRNPRIIASVGGKILWRVGPTGSLERSTSSGQDWVSQASGVTTDLLGGSAPSANVCWIIGSARTILRTADGGTHWLSVAPPRAPGELTGIRATDGSHARVWFAPDPQTGLVPVFDTSDGGATWTAAPGH